MNESLCPVTKKEFNCSECKVPDMSESGKCPIMEGDDYIQNVVELLRKVVEDEQTRRD